MFFFVRILSLKFFIFFFTDAVFLILYKELYYRHIYAKVSVSISTAETLLIFLECIIKTFCCNDFSFFLNQGGPTLEQRFESYYNYCNLFNYILSRSFLLLPFQHFWRIWLIANMRMFVNRCRWPRPLRVAKPMALGHHR